MKTLSEHPLAFKIHCFSLVCLQIGFQGTLQDDSTFLENLPEFFCRFIEFQYLLSPHVIPGWLCDDVRQEGYTRTTNKIHVTQWRRAAWWKEESIKFFCRSMGIWLWRSVSSPRALLVLLLFLYISSLRQHSLEMEWCNSKTTQAAHAALNS